MMRTVLQFISCICFFHQVCLAQGNINAEWTKIIHSSAGNAEAWGVATDGSGAVYWPVSMDSLPGNAYDIYCWKFDQDGIPLWSQPISIVGTGTHQTYVVKVTDSVVYLGGRYCAWLTNSCEMMIASLDKTTGSVEWFKAHDFMGEYDEIDAIEVGTDGLYLSGWATRAGNSWDSDAGIIKVNFSGDTIFTLNWGLDSTGEHFDGHSVLDSQYLYAVGLWKGTGIANLYEGRSILAKFDRSDGTLIDSVTFGYQDWWLNWENALGMTSDGNNLYITGVCTPSFFNNQVFIACFDKNLQQQWVQYWGGSITESARAIGVTNGHIYVAGSTDSPEYSSGAYDVFLLNYDTAGNFIDYKIWGGVKDDNAHDICFYGDDIFISGTTKNNLIDQNDSTLGAFLLKASLMNLGLPNKNSGSNRVNIFPNPATEYCTLSGSFGKEILEVDIIFSDLTGRKVLVYSELPVQGGVLEVELNISVLQPGIYLGHVVSGSGSQSFKLQVCK